MNEEQKRRGRPPKAALTVPHINGDTSREPEDVIPVKAAALDYANRLAYARRVWSGQSRDVPRNERIRRVTAALQAQGMSMEGVELP